GMSRHACAPEQPSCRAIRRSSMRARCGPPTSTACSLAWRTTARSGGVLPPLDLRLRQTHGAHLQAAHGGVPAHLLDLVLAELRLQAFGDDESRDDAVEDG